MKNMFFEFGKVFGFDVEKVCGLFKCDLMLIVVFDDFLSKVVI